MRKKRRILGLFLITFLLFTGLLLSSCGGIKCEGSCGRDNSDCRASCRESGTWCCNPKGD